MANGYKKCTNCGAVCPSKQDICDCGCIEFGPLEKGEVKSIKNIIKGKEADKKVDAPVDDEKTDVEPEDKKDKKDKKKKDK